MIPDGNTLYIKDAHATPLKFFAPLIKLGLQEKRAARLRWSVSLRGGRLFDAVAVFYPDKMYMDIHTTNARGVCSCSSVSIDRRPSNLIKGAFVSYFHNGEHFGRVLYYHPDNNSWDLRGERRPHYFSQYDRKYPTNDPTRKYGKMYYRGKLTPYGRRVLWYERNETRREYYILAGKHWKSVFEVLHS